MNKLFRNFIVFSALMLMPMMGFAAPNMTGSAFVNITSDTANTAKNMAMAEARRQIITDIVSKYADNAQFGELMQNTKDAELTNLISSTSIDTERLSSTTYSANIKMTVDMMATKKWLNDNNVQNWLAGDDSVPVDRSTVIIDVSGGLRDWIELNRALQENQLNLDIKRISGGVVTANIPVTNRSNLIATVRNAGWRFSDVDGFIRIWR
ncbi:hypothetical protein LJC18_00175 [Lachnospiraceae bacterium OttesenSCG-928-E19]|nr:hypothetical protein [Lachnospiraceae bacterium OttesenSCG-928-E19]